MCFRSALVSWLVALFYALTLCLAGGCSKTLDSALVVTESGTLNNETVAGEVAPPATPHRPNILLIMVDDLGYSDMGAYGGEIDTPNLDSLAQSGVQFTNFHSAPTCSPTRSMLFSGTDHHLAGVGSMIEYMRAKKSPRLGTPGYEGYLNFNVVSLATLLQDAGYHTYITGKWHLGQTEETSPAERGFEKSFVLMDGAASHFTDLGIQTQNPKATYFEDGEPTALPDDFYSTRFYTERMIAYLSEKRAANRPFFAYLSYTAPHFPLEAPDESVLKYSGKYDEGYDVLLERRLERMYELGLINAEASIPPRLPNVVGWDELDAEQKKVEARKMELFAAMVDDVDKGVARVIEHLESVGELDNTFIFFMSDNGPAWIDVDKSPMFAKHIEQCCDNSYENMGKAGSNSFVSYGSAWARAGAGHLRAAKGHTGEGGIRVPAFINYPKLIKEGRRSDAFASVMDVLPTLLDLAGTKHPGNLYKGRKVHPVKGETMLPLIEGKTDWVHDADYAMAWELFGRRGVRQGDWKLVWMERPFGTADWQLYNLKDDPGEQNDLSTQQSEKLKELLVFWKFYAIEGGMMALETGHLEAEQKLRR